MRQSECRTKHKYLLFVYRASPQSNSVLLASLPNLNPEAIGMRIKTAAIGILVLGASFAQNAAAAETQDVKACLQMIKAHVGVTPTPTVVRLCEQGKPKQAMKAAMAGD